LGEDRIRVLGKDAPRSWSLDPDRLRQVLSNLLRNALQASPPDEPVEVTVAGGRSAHGPELRIVVRDHGPGLPAGREKEIFEPFVTNRTRGTGLGLAVARRIVELHGGTLVGRNGRAGGAVFETRIPRA
jgi:two-component system, NtrC family, sensor histidine kinase HydH